MQVEERCRQAVRLGARGFDFFPASQWPLLKKYGLVPAVTLGGGITIPEGVVRKESHEALAKSLGDFLGRCAENGCLGVLISGGERRGISYGGREQRRRFLESHEGSSRGNGRYVAPGNRE